MNNRKVAVFDGDGTVIGQVPIILQMKPCIVMPIKTTRIETIRKQKQNCYTEPYGKRR